MPFDEPGGTGGAGPRPRLRPPRAVRLASPTPRAPRTSSSRSGRRRSRTSRSTSATSARRSTTCWRTCARARRSCCARPSRRARPTSSPATSPSTSACRWARTCSSPTRPSASRPGASSRRSTRCRASSAVWARRRASAPRSCSRSFAAPITQTTPVQAELAKIWTNILRYTTFALPNLLMMDCEQHGANVFDVIDLINRDYPRGGIAIAGAHRGDLPAQGLRVLRGALRTRRACCSPSRASTSRCRCSSWRA